MKWIEFNKSDFEIYSIENNHSRIVLSSHFIDSKEYDTKGVLIFLDYVPSTFKLKNILKNVQKWYDESEEINNFFINGEKCWIDKITRLSLLNSLNIQKELGLLETTLWYNTKNYVINIDNAIQFLKDLELYAMECYNVTQKHLIEIEALKTREEIMQYNITQNYPKQISLILPVSD